MQPLWVRVDLGTMAMKWCFTFPKAPALMEPNHQIVLYGTLVVGWVVVVLLLCRDAVGVFYSPI